MADSKISELEILSSIDNSDIVFPCVTGTNSNNRRTKQISLAAIVEYIRSLIQNLGSGNLTVIDLSAINTKLDTLQNSYNNLGSSYSLLISKYNNLLLALYDKDRWPSHKILLLNNDYELEYMFPTYIDALSLTLVVPVSESISTIGTATLFISKPIVNGNSIGFLGVFNISVTSPLTDSSIVVNSIKLTIQYIGSNNTIYETNYTNQELLGQTKTLNSSNPINVILQDPITSLATAAVVNSVRASIKIQLYKIGGASPLEMVSQELVEVVVGSNNVSKTFTIYNNWKN